MDSKENEKHYRKNIPFYSLRDRKIVRNSKNFLIFYLVKWIKIRKEKILIKKF